MLMTVMLIQMLQNLLHLLICCREREDNQFNPIPPPITFGEAIPKTGLVYAAMCMCVCIMRLQCVSGTPEHTITAGSIPAASPPHSALSPPDFALSLPYWQLDPKFYTWQYVWGVCGSVWGNCKSFHTMCPWPTQKNIGLLVEN